MTVRLRAPVRSELPVNLDLPRLRLCARTALQGLGHSRSEISVSLVGDDEIAVLNESWRGKRGPTDVLSFSLLEGEHREYRGRMLGDIVIGLPTAQRQARRRHRSLDEEVARLLIHGLLHLLGHDHEENAEARKMRSEERRLWSKTRARESS